MSDNGVPSQDALRFSSKFPALKHFGSSYINAWIRFDGSDIDPRPFVVLMDDLCFRYADILSEVIQRGGSHARYEKEALYELQKCCKQDIKFLDQIRGEAYMACISYQPDDGWNDSSTSTCTDLFDMINKEWHIHRNRCQRVIELPYE